MLYDNTYARELYAPGDSNCTGPRGYQVCPARPSNEWPRLLAWPASPVNLIVWRLQSTCVSCHSRTLLRGGHQPDAGAAHQCRLAALVPGGCNMMANLQHSQTCNRSWCADQARCSRAVRDRRVAGVQPEPGGRRRAGRPDRVAAVEGHRLHQAALHVRRALPILPAERQSSCCACCAPACQRLPCFRVVRAASCWIDTSSFISRALTSIDMGSLVQEECRHWGLHRRDAPQQGPEQHRLRREPSRPALLLLRSAADHPSSSMLHIACDCRLS